MFYALKILIVCLVLSSVSFAGEGEKEEGGAEGAEAAPAAPKIKISSDEQDRIFLEKKVPELASQLKSKEAETEKANYLRNSLPEDSKQLKEATQDWLKLSKELRELKHEYEVKSAQLKYRYPKQEGAKDEPAAEGEDKEKNKEPKKEKEDPNKDAKKLRPSLEDKVKRNLKKIEESYD